MQEAISSGPEAVRSFIQQNPDTLSDSIITWSRYMAQAVEEDKPDVVEELVRLRPEVLLAKVHPGKCYRKHPSVELS